MEDGEIKAEEGDISYTSQELPTARESQSLPVPEVPTADASQPQRKAKKAKPPKTAADYHAIYGEQGRAQVQVHNIGTIRTLDVQGLVLWVLANGMNPRWCFVKNKALVNKLVLVAIPGLDMELFKAKQEFMPVLHGQLGPPATVLAKNASVRSGSTLSTLFTVPFSKKRKRENEQQQTGGSQTGSKHKPFPAAHYTVTLEQMEANLYPLPSIDDNGNMTCPDGFAATQPAGDRSFPSMVSVDCEMCITAAGYELTRASLVDDKGQVLLDELVKPTNPITDYNTQFSGITPYALANVTTTLADIQQQFCQLVAAETLLVGHGLENDLTTMKIIHANCLDTALMYPHPKGPPFKPALRVLAERHLKRVIQQGEHDSVVDAQAAMDLVQLKIAKGPAFGTFSSQEQGDQLMDVLHAHQRRCTLIDRHDMLNRHVTAGASAVVAFSDDDATQKACKETANESVDFVWTQLRALGTFLGVRSQHVKESAQATVHADEAQLPSDPPPPSHAALDTASQLTPDQHWRSQQQPYQQQQDLQRRHPAEENTPKAAPTQPADCLPNAAQQAKNMQPRAAFRHAADVSANAVTCARPNTINTKAADAHPRIKAVAAERHTVEEEVQHTESYEVLEPGSDNSAGQSGKARTVHRHSLTKKRKRTDEHESEAVAAAPSAIVQGQACELPASPAAPPMSNPELTNGAGINSPQVNTATVNEPSASRQWQQDPANFTENKLNDVLRGLDGAVGRLLEALPINGMLILFTCQGDTAEYRRLQESKYRQQAGLDHLPAWTTSDEAKLAKTASQVCRALCFATVKQ